MTSLINKHKSRFRSASISNKILLIVLACSILSLILISASSVYRDYKMTAHRQLDQLRSMAGILSSNSVASLRFNDQETANEYLASLRSEPNITCAVLFDADGQVFADYHRDKSCPTPSMPDTVGEQTSARSFSFSQKIDLSGKELGTIIIKSDKNELWSQLYMSLLISSLVLVVALTISILLAKRLLPLITDPLEELANLAHRVSEDRNYSLRARKRNSDEIGMLVDSINFMLASVRQRDQAINETNRNLEQLVADRTAKLVEARERAETALETKSDFLATMSHELRTPMNAIIGMSSVLQFEDLDESRARQIEVIRKSSVNLLDLINDILDFSKIEANRLELENNAFDLVACIEEAMDITAAAKRNNRLVYCVNFDPTLPSHIKGDVTRVRQILVNLLNNAFKFTKKGTVTMDVFHLPADRRGSERIQISVRDTGIGIPEESLKSIFESFTQANGSTSREFGGTGLGLTISYRLALAMGGDIKVESEYGTGSVFHFTMPINRVDSLNSIVGKPLAVKQPPAILLKNLPNALDTSLRSQLTAWGCKIIGDNELPITDADIKITSALCEDEFRAVEMATRFPSSERIILLAHSDHAPLIRKTTAASVLTLPIRIRDLRNLILKFIDSSESPFTDETTPFAAYPTEKWKDLRILLAEDNELSRNVFLHHMELIGLEIDTASNGVDACELVLENNYDLVFMDVRMPVKDGIQATREIREKALDKQKPWIVGFTANTEPEALLDIKKAGMNDYLAKPALIGNIAEAINRYFFQRHRSTTTCKDA
ncbi:ATPase, histidine kinase-, DNA gyrase B-, and HSP90-like domain protein [Verrucomicrobiia bacterium DG1235]|nr:ATPase, histidine kinase-, DNA gyrase B-, and HSP90-like domain protein [Verrucomicrobiae bacterium DG1235]